MKKKYLLALSVIAVVAAAAGLYVTLNKRNEEDAPPKDAPQLDIQNPGDQSEFLTSPTEETELG